MADKLRLNSDHLQASAAVLGPQRSRLVPCAKKPDLHGHHPQGEQCLYCVYVPPARPSKVGWTVGRALYEDLSDGFMGDWAYMGFASRDYWEMLAASEVAVFQANNPGKLPHWHPDYAG